MTKVKYAIVVSMTSSAKFAYKIYKVHSPEYENRYSFKIEVETIEPVVGSFFALKKGETFLIDPDNLFDNKKQAIESTIEMIKSLSTSYQSHLINKHGKLFDYIFENADYPIKNFENVYKKFIRELNKNE